MGLGSGIGEKFGLALAEKLPAEMVKAVVDAGRKLDEEDRATSIIADAVAGLAPMAAWLKSHRVRIDIEVEEKLRIGVGIERGFGSAWRLRIDATWQKTGLNVFNAPTDDIYLRVRVFHMWM